MTKHELVKAMVAKIDGATQKEVSNFLDVFADVVKEEVEKGEKIALTGFITFEKKHVPAKTGVSRLGGSEMAWSTEAHDEVKATLSKTYKLI